MILYRFTKLKYFEELVTKNKMVFISPYKWPDPFEGYLYKYFMPIYEKDILKYFKSQGIGEIFYPSLIDIISKAIYSQCWTRLEEDIDFWKRYGDSTTRIEIDTKSIDKINLTRHNTLKIHVQNIEYNDDINFMALLKKVIYSRTLSRKEVVATRPEKAFIQKRTQYSHEVETRLTIYDLNYRIADSSRLTLDVDIKEPIQDFIKSVKLSPLASETDEGYIKSLCEKYSLNYLGKSSMDVSSASS